MYLKILFVNEHLKINITFFQKLKVYILLFLPSVSVLHFQLIYGNDDRDCLISPCIYFDLYIMLVFD